jgi:hypothetical protein
MVQRSFDRPHQYSWSAAMSDNISGHLGGELSRPVVDKILRLLLVAALV